MDPFVAEIRMFAGNFAPTGWALCNGQILPIAQNTALFSLLGTTYGGDGRTTFALPDLRDRAPMQSGQGPGLSDRFLGEEGGQSTVTLLDSQMPIHNHAATIVATAATTGDPQNNGAQPAGPVTLAVASTPVYSPVQNFVAMGDQTGGGLPHENRQPYLALTFIIALQGVFPPRS
jgi:microcystin-dependent protein